MNEIAQHNIRTNFPDFVVNGIEFLGEGMDSAAFLVNGEWVFRFPKHGVVVGCVLPASRLQSPMFRVEHPQPPQTP